MVLRWDRGFYRRPRLATGWSEAGGHCRGWNEGLRDLGETRDHHLMWGPGQYDIRPGHVSHVSQGTDVTWDPGNMRAV